MAPRIRNYQGGHTGECRGSAARAHGRGQSGERSLKSAALTSPFPTALPSLGGYIRAGETKEEIPHTRKAVANKIPAMSAICPGFFFPLSASSLAALLPAPALSHSLTRSLARSLPPLSLPVDFLDVKQTGDRDERTTARRRRVYSVRSDAHRGDPYRKRGGGWVANNHSLLGLISADKSCFLFDMLDEGMI